MELLEYTEMVGERIQDWIDKKLTFENGCKREWNEDDSFEEDEVSWMFSQKGQRLYSSYLSKAQKLIERKFPNEEYEDLENHTGVIYP